LKFPLYKSQQQANTDLIRIQLYPAQFCEDAFLAGFKFQRFAMAQSIKSGRVGRGSQIRSDKTTRPSESR